MRLSGRWHYGWVVLGAGLLVQVIGSGTRYSFGVFFNSLESDFGWTRAMTSGVFSAYMGVGILALVISGWALDRYGPRVMLTAMGLFTGLSLLLTSQVSALWQMFLTYSFLLAAGTGGYWIITIATASKWFPRRRGLATGIVNAGNGLGIMAVSPVAAHLIAGYGWRQSYIILGLTAFVVLSLGALLMRRAPGEAAAPPTADNPPSAGPVPGDFSLLQAARTGNFWLLFSVMFLLGLCVFSILTHIVPHVIDLGIDPLTAASILSLIGGTSALGGLAAGRLSDSLGSRQTSVIFALVTAGAMLWLTRATSLWMLYVFAVFFGFFYSGLLPSLAALLADLFGLRHLGTLLGARNVAWAVGAAVGPAFTGYVFDLYGNYQAAFWGGMGAMLGIAVLVFFTRIPPTERKPV